MSSTTQKKPIDPRLEISQVISSVGISRKLANEVLNDPKVIGILNDRTPAPYYRHFLASAVEHFNEQLEIQLCAIPYGSVDVRYEINAFFVRREFGLPLYYDDEHFALLLLILYEYYKSLSTELQDTNRRDFMQVQQLEYLMKVLRSENFKLFGNSEPIDDITHKVPPKYKTMMVLDDISDDEWSEMFGNFEPMVDIKQMVPPKYKTMSDKEWDELSDKLTKMTTNEWDLMSDKERSDIFGYFHLIFTKTGPDVGFSHLSLKYGTNCLKDPKVRELLEMPHKWPIYRHLIDPVVERLREQLKLESRRVSIPSKWDVEKDLLDSFYCRRADKIKQSKLEHNFVLFLLIQNEHFKHMSAEDQSTDHEDFIQVQQLEYFLAVQLA